MQLVVWIPLNDEHLHHSGKNQNMMMFVTMQMNLKFMAGNVLVNPIVEVKYDIQDVDSSISELFVQAVSLTSLCSNI